MAAMLVLYLRKFGSIMKFEIKYLKHFDLIFHVLAYLKVDNASDLYCEKYIQKMAIEKQDFGYNIILDINLLREYYNNHFERLMLINFLPFYSNSFEEMKNTLLTYNRFSPEDLQHFINPFIKILNNEAVFFFDYWNMLNKKNEQIKYSIEEKMKNELQKFSCVFDYYKKSALTIFSYSLTRWGRGYNGLSSFSAVVPFPESNDIFLNSFIQLIHEYTHQFTDKLLQSNINMTDGSHNLSENIAVLTSYYLIKTIDENIIPKYIQWFTNNNKITEAKFLDAFKVNKNLENEIKKLVDNILHSRML